MWPLALASLEILIYWKKGKLPPYGRNLLTCWIRKGGFAWLLHPSDDAWFVVSWIGVREIYWDHQQILAKGEWKISMCMPAIAKPSHLLTGHFTLSFMAEQTTFVEFVE